MGCRSSGLKLNVSFNPDSIYIEKAHLQKRLNVDVKSSNFKEEILESLEPYLKVRKSKKVKYDLEVYNSSKNQKIKRNSDFIRQGVGNGTELIVDVVIEGEASGMKINIVSQNKVERKNFEKSTTI